MPAFSRLGITGTDTTDTVCLYTLDSDKSTQYAISSTGILPVGTFLANEYKTVRIKSYQRINDMNYLSADMLAAHALGTATYPITPSGQPFPKNAAGAFVYPADAIPAKIGQPLEFSVGEPVGAPLWYYLDSNTAKALPITVADGSVSFNGTSHAIDMLTVHQAYGALHTVYALQTTDELVSAITGADANAFGHYCTSLQLPINGAFTAVTPHKFAVFNLANSLLGTTTASLTVLQGIVSLDTHYVNGTAARQNAVLDRLNDNAFMTSFSDPTIFKCRYMVDSFKTILIEQQRI
jgi:hypothetical protein